MGRLFSLHSSSSKVGGAVVSQSTGLRHGCWRDCGEGKRAERLAGSAATQAAEPSNDPHSHPLAVYSRLCTEHRPPKIRVRLGRHSSHGAGTALGELSLPNPHWAQRGP